MNEKFPVLSTVSSILKLVGWFGVFAGALYAVYEGVIEPFLPEHMFGGEDFLQLVVGCGVGVIGLITVAFSEVIGVLFAIEENTRNSRPRSE
ncbi:MAG: hypothetical protein IID08_06250 [Candidatus Hydrogenedentes bacterium]|nr:hypothetical protein [Candidatus Hydrogenedentota bacterium]